MMSVVIRVGRYLPSDTKSAAQYNLINIILTCSFNVEPMKLNKPSCVFLLKNRLKYKVEWTENNKTMLFYGGIVSIRLLIDRLDFISELGIDVKAGKKTIRGYRVRRLPSHFKLVPMVVSI